MQKFLLNRRDAKVLGVGAGIADATGLDPLIVRLGLILAVLVTGPIAIILYLAAAWLASDR
ncbi:MULTISPECIES: PspC domain-containing protein [Sphingomonas]|uniref:PspC domain-containing protein n=1 Tax=Sphingomonas TaxID=13687 RepID=UPI000DEF4B32|nr:MULTISPECIES: PspC domain-containing protein [Sphingomonas]